MATRNPPPTDAAAARRAAAKGAAPKPAKAGRGGKPGAPGKGGKPARRGGATRRNATPVAKPKPWGLIAAGVALALVVGVIVAAPLLFGEDDPAVATTQVEGVMEFTDPPLTNNHVETPVTYPQTPPVGGDHSINPQRCDGQVYDEPVRNENAVHALEHGATWFTYRPDLPEEQVGQLEDMVQREPFRLMSPYPDLPAPIVASVWGKQITAETASDPRLRQFTEFNNVQRSSQEPGASCSYGTTETVAG